MEKLKLEDMYKGSFFSKRHKLRWRVAPMCNAVANALKPESIIDVGCATADLVAGFLDLGISANGIEGSKNCLPYLDVSKNRVFILDLRRELTLFRKWDVAMSLEVAEHIEKEFASMYVYNLTKLSDKILLTAATPGQGGHHHFNCQSHDYWIYKFHKMGYQYDPSVVNKVREGLEEVRTKKEMSSWYGNMLFFERKDSW